MDDRINRWLKQLDEYEHAYYNAEPIIDDAKYDALKDMVLRQLPPDHPRLSKIGHPVSSAWSKKKHIIPMGSQNKVSSEKAIQEWINKTLNNLGLKEAEFILQHKIDGFSLEVCYSSGKIDSAQTRGDGIIGENIIENARLFRQLPSIIPIKNNVVVRGEGVLYKKDYEYVQKKKMEDEKVSYKNARNAASGISRRLDGKFSKFLRVIAYDINAKVSKETEKIEALNKLGFFTVKTYLCRTAKEVIELYKSIKDIRKSNPYEFDGLVLKLNDIYLQEKLGVKNNKPEGQIALKFDSEQIITTVKGFKLQIGRTGKITPVVLLEPVDLMGSTIKKASVHNFSLMAEIGIGKGAEVVIKKKGDIIPQVTEVLNEGDPFEIPETCPSCGGPLKNDGVNIWCLNDICRERDINKIVYWIKTLDMKGFSGKFVQKLWDLGKLRNISDIYKLNPDDFISVEGIGEKTIRSFFKIIKSTSEMYLDKFITALGIPSCSKSTAEILVTEFGSWDKIVSIKPNDLSKLFGFAEISSINICKGISEVSDMASDLLNVIKIKEKKKGALTGKSLCVTGSLSSMGRKEFYEIVEENGGIAKNSVSEGLDYLVTNDNNMSNKMRKAKKYKIKTINEEEFIKMIGGLPVKESEKDVEDYDIQIVSESLF